MPPRTVTSSAILFAHLAITLPALAAVPLFVYWGLYQFGPPLWPYYVSGGVAIAWQWYSMAVPRWKGLLKKRGVNDEEAEEIAKRIGLVWPGAAAAGSFALHTTAALLCCPWFLSRWFVWLFLMLGISPTQADFWLQHLELLSIIPAIAVGYLISRYFEKLATWAWVLPTIILSYKLLNFTDPQISVLAPNPWSRFSYYFVILRYAPTFYDLGGSDPVRVVEQMTVIAPFYSGIAYSLGAVMQKYKSLERLISSLRRDPEPQVFGPKEADIE